MNFRRLAGIGALGAAASLTLAIPNASAATVTYQASSDGRALVLDVLEQGLTAGLTHADLSSDLTANASGTGLANPLADAGVSEASVDGDGQSDGSADEVCDSDALPELPGLGIGLACSASLAAVTDGAPASAASARVGLVGVDPVNGLLIDQLGLEALVEGLQDGVDQIREGLTPLTGPIADGGLDVDQFVNDLTSALDQAPLVGIDIGPTSVDTARTADAVTTTCTAEGATVRVLDIPPVGDIDPEPVITVIVGQASTAVSASTVDGTPTQTVEPALVRVLVPSLELDIPVGPGDTVEIPLPEPLGTSTISVAGGTTGENEDGLPFARASAVRLDLVPSLNGGVELALSDCLSVAGASVQPEETTTTTSTTTTQPTLPRTGGTGVNGLALFGAVGLAGISLLLLRRSAVA